MKHLIIKESVILDKNFNYELSQDYDILKIYNDFNKCMSDFSKIESSIIWTKNSKYILTEICIYSITDDYFKEIKDNINELDFDKIKLINDKTIPTDILNLAKEYSIFNTAEQTKSELIDRIQTNVEYELKNLEKEKVNLINKLILLSNERS